MIVRPTIAAASLASLLWLSPSAEAAPRAKSACAGLEQAACQAEQFCFWRPESKGSVTIAGKEQPIGTKAYCALNTFKAAAYVAKPR